MKINFNNLEDDGKMELNIRRIKEDDYQKIFVLTDIHGRFDLFEKIIEKIDLKKEDLLLILGDSCDRGKFSFELYNWYKEMIQKGYNIIHLMGNHENMLFKSISDENSRLNWLYNGGNVTVKSFFEHQTEEKTIDEYWKNNKFYEEKWLFNFIEKMPHIIESENHLFVHAGIDFSKNLEDQEIKYLLWTRDDWYKKNNTGKIVYYGHTPQKDISIRNNCINLDSGCFFSDVLRCVELKEKKLFVLKNNNVKIEKFDIERIEKKLTEERKKEYEKLIEDYKEYIIDLENKTNKTKKDEQNLLEVKENLKKLIGLKRILEK